MKNILIFGIVSLLLIGLVAAESITLQYNDVGGEGDFTFDVVNLTINYVNGTSGTANLTGYYNSPDNETDPIYSAWDKQSGINISESQIYDLNHTIDTYISKWTIDDNSLINDTSVLKVSQAWINETIENYTAIRYYNVTSISLIAGTTTSVLADIQAYNNNYYNISESLGTPALDLRINFTDVDDFNEIIIRMKTTLNTQDTIIYLWDYDESEWEEYTSYNSVDAFNTFSLGVFDSDSHLSGGLVQMRVYQSDAGNINHKHIFDWVVLSKGVATFSTTESDPLSVHIEDLNLSYFDYDGTLTIDDIYVYNTGDSITGNINMSNNNISNINYLNSENVNVGGGYGNTGTSLYSNGNIFMDGDLFIGGDILNVYDQYANGSIIPQKDSLFDLGSITYNWNDIYADGYAFLYIINATNIDVDQVDVSSSIDGAGINVITFSDSSKLQLQASSGIELQQIEYLYPLTDDHVDLGKTGQEFKDLYVDGTGYIDAISGGTIAVTGSISSTTGTISTTGALLGSSLNTGQGAYELYAMNQNVRTTDEVEFDDLTLTQNKGAGATLNVLIDTDEMYIASNSTHSCMVGKTSGSKICIQN